MALEDLTPWFENLRNPSEEIDPDTIINNITQVYQNDLSIRDAAVKETTAERDALKEREQKLMAENYKLLMRQPQGNVPDESQQQQDDPDDRAATVTFADIFKK
jgi:hypothetical protein